MTQKMMLLQGEKKKKEVKEEFQLPPWGKVAAGCTEIVFISTSLNKQRLAMVYLLHLTKLTQALFFRRGARG